MQIALFLILGLVIGSFLNVVVLRLHLKKSFFLNRSECPKCQHKLKWYELIPLASFFIQLGKCRNCNIRISWQYPAVELVTGLVFVILFLVFGLTYSALVYIVLACFLIVIFVYDLRFGLILDKVILPAVVLAVIGNFLIGRDWLDVIIGFIAGGLFFLLQFVVSKGKWIGGGDIRLGALMGLILGWQGLLVALFLSYVIGALVSIFVVILSKKKLNSKIPFGTFLTLATFATIIFGDSLINFYLSLI